MSLDAMAEINTGVTVGEVDEAAALANLDSLARRFLGISGEEFLRRREDGSLGELEYRSGFTHVMAVATLLD
jgi:hypothetical protein